MKILLTGAGGFLGRYASLFLRRQGIEVVAIGRSNPELPIEFYDLDILQTKNFKPLLNQIKPTHLIHLAWYTEHQKYWSSMQNTFWVESTARLVQDFCLSGGQKVIISGTCAEYDWFDGICIEEKTSIKPTSLYGIAKNNAHQIAESICKDYQADCVWMRVFFPYGLGENKNRLIPSLIDVYKGKRDPFSINAGVSRDFFYAEDIGSAILALLKVGVKGVFNVSSGVPTPIGRIAKLIADLLNADPSLVLDLPPRKTEEPLTLVGDNSKLCAIGWRPSLTIEQGLERIILEE